MQSIAVSLIVQPRIFYKGRKQRLYFLNVIFQVQNIFFAIQFIPTTLIKVPRNFTPI